MNFKLERKEFVQEVNSEAHIYTHTTGAKLIYLKNDDDNKVFSIGFKTLPENSTGVPHILEHSVLSGSRKYRTKEPFMDLIKGSLQTFINAMTFSDKTIYPVASKNHKDFRNLMDVYLDSVFFPKTLEDEEVFMQEGWHYEIFQKEDPIIYNGVVYNEMKGAYSEPLSILMNHIDESLYPDTIYANSSGGDPYVIPNLTYEYFKEFYHTFYHPSNSYIYLYGDMNIEECLEHLEEYLSHFEKNEPIEIKRQEAIEYSEVEKYYNISKDGIEEDNTYLSMNFSIGETKDVKKMMMAEVLKDALINSSAAPIKEALLKNKIGKDIICLLNTGVDATLSFVAKNANGEDKEKFKETIYTTLTELSKGMNKDLLLSSINSFEYNLREADGFSTKGIIYYITLMDSLLYGGDPLAYLKYNDIISELREGLNNNLFEDFIKENFLDNKAVSIVSLVPKKELNKEKDEKVRKFLEDYKNSLSEDEIKELIKKNESLQAKQLEPDSEEDKKTVPKLSLEDVNKENEIIPIEVIEDDKVKLIYHDVFTSGISYLNYIFDISFLTVEEVKDLTVLNIILGEIDTKTYNYSDLNNEIYKYTGGINTAVSNYVDVNDVMHPTFEFITKTINGNINELNKLMHILLTETIIEDKDRIRDLLNLAVSRIEMTIGRWGNRFAKNRVTSYFSAAGAFSEITSGFENYWLLRDTLNDYDAKADDLLVRLNKVYKKVFNINNLVIGFTGDRKEFDAFKASYKDSVAVNTNKVEKAELQFDLSNKYEGITSSSDVNYCAMGYNFKEFGYKYTGAMDVCRGILNTEFLHNRVRAKGGAYGVGIQFSKSGSVVATSYRDPNIKNTFNVFKEIGEFLENLELTEEELTIFIIGAIGSLDAALTPEGKGMLSTKQYLAGYTEEMLLETRQEILNTKLSDIKELSKLLKDVMDKDYRAVYGNERAIEEDGSYHVVKLK